MCTDGLQNRIILHHRWQMNSLRSTVVGVYASRQLKAGDAAQPKGCSASFVLWCANEFAGVIPKNDNSENG